MLASSLAFIITIPISYFGHGNFTFQIKNTNKAQLKRYLIYVVFGFVCSNLIMYLSSTSNYLNAYIGVIIITVLFPIINFLALKFLVFSKND
jgi:putative flippase GtrA